MEHISQAKPNYAASEVPKLSEEWLTVFGESMALLTEAFQREATPVAVLAYRQGLEDLTAEELQLATDAALKRHLEFMPSPGQLKQYLREHREAMPKMESAKCSQCGGSGWRLPPGKETAERCKHERMEP